ncbi:DUF5050 domain-containing protein [Paenibacillus qinlingensis]|uniref:Prolow-density lipoprotein receptor-related protein 1-like beta-propeller domain-containing protein n=1 Tax=Paenibacillus qinlingensis TaxID=1837343 RepID=A0ABU1NNL3_9BACL|nr:DUF5050 domain-containing protein [Paenibacillus qinlingensis]MDR6549071.1 hypothetical protein [Paenibacillus qinlingensis]
MNDQASSHISEAGDYLYYLADDDKVYRILKSGNEKASVVIDAPVWFYQVYESHIYYTDRNITTYKPTNLLRMNMDGSNKKVLGEGVSIHFAVQNNNVYYETFSKSGTFLNRMNLDGTEPKKITELSSLFDFQIVEPYVYFGYKDIWEMLIDGTGNVKKINKDVNNPLEFIVDQDWIYYMEGSSSADIYLYRMRRDGSEITAYSPNNMRGFNIAGDWIYAIVSDPTKFL